MSTRDDDEELSAADLGMVKLWQAKAARYRTERDAARTKASELQTELNHTKIAVEGQTAITSMADDAERARCTDIEALGAQILKLEKENGDRLQQLQTLVKEREGDAALIQLTARALDDEKARVVMLSELHKTMMGHADEDRRAAIVALKSLVQPCEGDRWCATPESGNEFHQAQHRAGALVRRLEVYLGTKAEGTDG